MPWLSTGKGVSRVGLIGDPVEHSISPDFQQAAFDALGIAARYERWRTTGTALADRIAGLRLPNTLGANITVPHKEAVMPLLDEIDHRARRAGAVNTIVAREGRLAGFNTDVAGFRLSLRETGGFAVGGKHVMVLGAGGAARAVVLALEQEGAAGVQVANRHPERAKRLVRDLLSDGGPDLVAIPWEKAISPSALRRAQLLVNCTSIGLAGSSQAQASPLPPGSLHAGLFVCDIVANPAVTPLLAAARAAGAGWLGGLAMLVYQGAASFTLWTRREAPFDVMLEAAAQAMCRRSDSKGGA